MLSVEFSDDKRTHVMIWTDNETTIKVTKEDAKRLSDMLRGLLRS